MHLDQVKAVIAGGVSALGWGLAKTLVARGLVALIVLGATAAYAAPLPIADFAKRGQFSNPHLSPDGRYLAVTVRDRDGGDDVWRLAIYRLADMQVTSLLKMPRFELPADYVWASDTRLVIAKGRDTGSIEAPRATGEIIATDLDGKNQAYLYGSEHEDSLRTRAKGQDHGYGSIEGVPDQRNGRFYLRERPWDNDRRSIVYDVDANDGTRKLIADIGVPELDFLLQHDGTARFAFGTNENDEYVVYRRDSADSDWKNLSADSGKRFVPVAFTPDNKQVFAYFSADGGPDALVRQATNGNERELLAADAFASVSGLQWGLEEQPFAGVLHDGIPRLVYFDDKRPEAQLHKTLSAKFPGEFLSFISISNDHSRFLLGVASDRDPGSFYLFDAKAKRIDKLFATMPWIDQGKMAEQRPIHFKASDGIELGGYLTLPPGRGEKNLPLVLLPHGGPHGIADKWFFDEDAQFLASRGYAVLQVNFRGSGGRGVNFQKSGYLNWGTRIQDDLLDGVRWAIKEGFADSKKVCAYGASFGGYSALMSAIRGPELIQCAVGYAGIYDLPMMYEKGDIQTRRSGRNYLRDVIGKDSADLAANSPTHLIDKLKAPVLIVHGEADERAPFAQAEALRKALEKAGKPYEWLAVPKEGHGFYTEEHRKQFYEKLEAFLAKHLG